MSDKTFLLELREQAQQEPRAVVRVELRVFADAIDHAVRDLWKKPTDANMIELNGLWARAAVLLRSSQERPEPEPPLAGSPEVFAEDVEEAA